VHKGKLHDGTVVAVKVQHAGMHVILTSDIKNCESLMSWLNLLEPDFDFKKV
jgi:predicted unusual protein kinase regulating ubiquinone biosynthesis (AarF/ABC1/UbiB family)